MNILSTLDSLAKTGLERAEQFFEVRNAYDPPANPSRNQKVEEPTATVEAPASVGLSKGLLWGGALVGTGIALAIFLRKAK